jgi:hypothetical protein
MGEKTNRLLGGEAFGPTCSAFHELREEVSDV